MNGSYKLSGICWFAAVAAPALQRSKVKEPGHSSLSRSENHPARSPGCTFFSFFSCRPQNTGRQRRFTVKIKQIKRSDMVNTQGEARAWARVVDLPARSFDMARPGLAPPLVCSRFSVYVLRVFPSIKNGGHASDEPSNRYIMYQSMSNERAYVCRSVSRQCVTTSQPMILRRWNNSRCWRHWTQVPPTSSTDPSNVSSASPSTTERSRTPAAQQTRSSPHWAPSASTISTTTPTTRRPVMTSPAHPAMTSTTRRPATVPIPPRPLTSLTAPIRHRRMP